MIYDNALTAFLVAAVEEPELNRVRTASQSTNQGRPDPLASGLPASSENADHPRQFRVHLGKRQDRACVSGTEFACSMEDLVSQEIFA